MFGTSKVINRRQFLKYGFNTATGVLAASLGVLGFSAILLPPGADSGGSNNGVIFWAKGREDEAWYGAKHELPMTRQDFVDEAAKSSTGTAGAAGIWERRASNCCLRRSREKQRHSCHQWKSKIPNDGRV